MNRRRLLALTAGGFGLPLLPTADASQDEFDPTVHGFGFRNWSGTTGTGADGEEFSYEPAELTLEEVREEITENWETALSSAQEAILTRIVYSWIGGNAATNGHCYGMVLAAEAYFREPDELPASVDSASEIPRPTDDYDDVGDRIRRLQSAQLLRLEPYWFGFLGLRWGLADHDTSLAQLTDAIDATGTAGVSLDGEANAHQVLAHDYERTVNVTRVKLYDPTFAAVEHDGDDGPWILSVEHDTGEVREMREGYDEFLYHDPEMDLQTAGAMIEGPERLLDTLSDAVFLGLSAGGALEIDVPEDVLVDRPGAEYADFEGATYADAAVVLDPPEEFEVSVDGEEGETVELEVLGLRGAELVLDDVISANVTDVPPRLAFSVDEAGDLVVEVLEEVDEETPDADEGPGWVADRWWVPAVVGAAGLGGAYLYLKDRVADERSGE